MRPILLLLLALCLASPIQAADATPQTLRPLEKEKFHLGPWEDEIGYTQAVKVGNVLYVSGSVGKGAMPDAIKGAYGELARTLAAYHLTFAHVVKENIFTTQLDELKKHKEMRRIFYGNDFPASSWIQVSRLYQPEFVIEVEITAVFPDAADEKAKSAAP